jgi:WD40 repeat protein
MALAAEGDQIVTLSEHEILSWRASDCHVTGHQQLRAELVALTSDGNHAVTAVNAELTLWTGEDLKALKTISHGGRVTCLTMWPRSAGQLLFIVTGSRDRAIRLWDLATGECLSTIEDAHQGPITALRVLSQGRHVISYSDTDQHVKVWELADKECVLQHHVSESCVRTSAHQSGLRLESSDCARGSVGRSVVGHRDSESQTADRTQRTVLLHSGQRLTVYIII